jgi:hypothetical protein
LPPQLVVALSDRSPFGIGVDVLAPSPPVNPPQVNDGGPDAGSLLIHRPFTVSAPTLGTHAATPDRKSSIADTGISRARPTFTDRSLPDLRST